MFPNYIDSKFIGCQKQAVLWQMEHYYYEVDITGMKHFLVLADTSFERAVEIFNNIPVIE